VFVIKEMFFNGTYCKGSSLKYLQSCLSDILLLAESHNGQVTGSYVRDVLYKLRCWDYPDDDRESFKEPVKISFEESGQLKKFTTSFTTKYRSKILFIGNGLYYLKDDYGDFVCSIEFESRDAQPVSNLRCNRLFFDSKNLFTLMPDVTDNLSDILTEIRMKQCVFNRSPVNKNIPSHTIQELEPLIRKGWTFYHFTDDNTKELIIPMINNKTLPEVGEKESYRTIEFVVPIPPLVPPVAVPAHPVAIAVPPGPPAPVVIGGVGVVPPARPAHPIAGCSPGCSGRGSV
jgi:hypothetical protein